jgi:phytoene desaturase
MVKKKVVIIGAGFSGLAAAALLARQGFDVTVLEKNAHPGGVAGVLEEQGFCFDLGPSWYLMPEVFERFFAQFGKRPADFFELIRLDPYYQVFFGPGDSVEISPDLERTCALFDRLEPNGGAKLREYLRLAKHKYDLALGEFLYRDYCSIFDFFQKKILLEGPRLHIFQKLDAYARRYFTSDRARKLLEYNIVFLGCSPFKSPALYSIMSHVDMTLGVYYPRGGIYQVAKALEQIAREQGVACQYATTASRITVADRTATGVVTSSGWHEAEFVVAATDYHHAETELLESPYQSYPEQYWQRKLLAPSAFIVYLGLNRSIPHLRHHNLYLAQNWEAHFEAIFDQPAWPENPSYYVACPSKTDGSVAPPGCENLFILVPVAPGLNDSDQVREAFYEKIISHLEGLTGTSLREAIIYKKICSQRDFSQAFNMYRGTAMGLAHTLWQTALFRPAHASRKVANLYYTGHYTHPGIGLPMVLIASQIVSAAVARRAA